MELYRNNDLKSPTTDTQTLSNIKSYEQTHIISLAKTCCYLVIYIRWNAGFMAFYDDLY